MFIYVYVYTKLKSDEKNNYENFGIFIINFILFPVSLLHNIKDLVNHIPYFNWK